MQSSRWSGWRLFFLLSVMTLATLELHGFHPLSEDGGLYVAGIKSLLDPGLYPRTLPFVREHLRFSLFAPAIASLVRWTHLSLAWWLLLLYALSIAATLAATRAILQRLGFTERAVLPGIAVVAACWTMPVAATSLMMMDPYLTARSLTLPLTLMALAWSLDRSALSSAAAGVALLLAALLHPLMAFYGAVLAGAVVILRLPRRKLLLPGAACLAFAIAAALTVFSSPESVAERLAASSRYYWFLSQWHGYEYLGLFGPLAIFVGLRLKARRTERVLLLNAAILCGFGSVLLTLIFAQEHFRAHPVARLQPLRIFVELYLLMLSIGVASLAEGIAARARSLARWTPWLIVACGAAAFFCVARSNYGASPQVELPWRVNTNPWSEAFLWARDNTPRNTLFALDARYVNRDGEDAQTFRATAERDALPDYSKDGGEAAILPALAEEWLRAAAAQQDLDAAGDASRYARLAPFGVDDVVLNAATPTAHPCPYRNAVVKICRLR